MSYLGRSAKLSLKAQEKVSFLATAGQTVKTGLSYTPSFIEVYVNGVLLTDNSDYTATNGNSITFTVALLLNDEVTVISLKTFTVADHYTKSDADTLLAAKATNTALALKAPIASPVFTGTSTFQQDVNIGTTTPTNLISNSEFTTNTTGWAASGSALAIVSNQLQLTPNSGVNGFANQQVSGLVIGKSYIASVAVTVDAGSYARLYIGTSANGNQTLGKNNLGVGTHSFTFIATATTHHFALAVGGGTGQVTRFDNARLTETSRIIFPAISGVSPEIKQGNSVNDLAISTGSINRINIDAAGYVAMPKMATSFCRLKGPSGIANVSNSFNIQRVAEDPDSLYTVSNGRFTCPVDGLYSMNAMTINATSTNQTSQAYPFKNGSEISGGRLYVSINADHASASATVLTRCSAGDYLQWLWSGTVYDGVHANANFMLVHAE